MALATPPMRFQGWPLPTSPSGNDSPAVDSESLEGARNDRCSQSIAVSADQWPDDLRLSNIEDRFVCHACGKRSADVRPDFNWDKTPVRVMGYR